MMAEVVVATYEFIRIVRLPKPRIRKTHRYSIGNKSGRYLGLIKWSGGWRQFAFFPEGATIWSAGCLKDVQTFLLALKTNRAHYEEEINDANNTETDPVVRESP